MFIGAAIFKFLRGFELFCITWSNYKTVCHTKHFVINTGSEFK